MSFIRVPPDGAGKKVYTKTHTVGADSVEAQIFHLADETNPLNILQIDSQGSASVRFAEGQPSLSGFGALNVSQKRALGVYESSSGSYDDLFSIEVTTGGSNVYDDVGHGMLLTVNGVSGASVKRTTNRYHYYLPGAANQYVGTISCGDTGKVGNTRRWGAFDDLDGVFFELEDTVLNVVVRSSTTGSVVERKIPQSQWNVDKLDGTGISEFVIDITKINIYWIDYQWLGAGRIRFGVYASDGSRIVSHIFENAGNFALPYMRTGTLPIRTENLNTSATGSTSELRETCQAMYTEGTYEDYTFWRSSDIDSTKTVGATDTLIVAIRSKPFVPGLNHHNSIVCYPETLNVYTDQPFRLDLMQDVEVSGGTWTITNGDSSVEASSDASLTASVKPFKTWFFGPGTHTVSLTEFFEVNDEGIMLKADDTAEIWSFVAKRLSGTDASVTINLGYRELW